MEVGSKVQIAVVAVAPLFLCLMLPRLYPRMAWLTVSSGVALAVMVLTLQYRHVADACSAGVGPASDCDGTVGGLFVYGLYFGGFSLFGILRVIFDLRKKRIIAFKG